MGSTPTRGNEIFIHFFALVSRQSAALSSATQHAMPPEFGGNWGTECLNTRFPLPTPLCTRYSVKLIVFYNILNIYNKYIIIYEFCFHFIYSINLLTVMHTHLSNFSTILALAVKIVSFFKLMKKRQRR